MVSVATKCIVHFCSYYLNNGKIMKDGKRAETRYISLSYLDFKL